MYSVGWWCVRSRSMDGGEGMSRNVRGVWWLWVSCSRIIMNGFACSCSNTRMKGSRVELQFQKLRGYMESSRMSTGTGTIAYSGTEWPTGVPLKQHIFLNPKSQQTCGLSQS
jgi:hypothetical protein